MNASGSWAEREAELVELELSAILAIASEASEAFWETLPAPSSPRELWAMMFAGVEAVCQLSGFLPREEGSDPIGLQIGPAISDAELLAMRMICARANGEFGTLAHLWAFSPNDGTRESAHGFVIVNAARLLAEDPAERILRLLSFDPWPSPELAGL